MIRMEFDYYTVRPQETSCLVLNLNPTSFCIVYDVQLNISVRYNLLDHFTVSMFNSMYMGTWVFYSSIRSKWKTRRTTS